MEAKGIAVWQLGIGDGARGGSRPAEAGYRKRMSLRLRLRPHTRGDEQEPSQAGLVGSAGGGQHTAKSSIHFRPDMYARRSCAERCVFTPGDPSCCHWLRVRVIVSDHMAEVSSV